MICSNFQEQQQGGSTDEAEPFMGSGRFGNENDLNLIIPGNNVSRIADFTVCILIFMITWQHELTY